jgi:nucleoside-diphosphate-sugar epimerase
MKILLTGAAGFIGMSTALRLLARGDEVVGLDNLNDYYEVSLKEDRLRQLTSLPGFRFAKLDVADRPGIERLFAAEGFERVIHLAAQAGVRYSLKNPHAYVDSNVVGFVNILEGCRHNQVQHLVYASSSSVYGGNTRMPFSEHDSVDHPVSLYAATKKANELMAHTYSHLYGLPTTGLRFFTVYGPWGRPDMALFLFTRAILEGRPIDVFNHGEDAARLHLRGRHRRRRDPGDGSLRHGQCRAICRTRPTRRRATCLTGCSTSAITSRCRCSISSVRSRTRLAGRRKSACCRCRTATCRRPMPIRHCWRTGLASRLPRRWRKG